MNAKIIGVILLGVASVATALAMETETIAYFPLDTDARSIVNADRHPIEGAVVEYLAPGYSPEITYEKDFKGATICDADGFLRENKGCVRLKWSRIGIDLSNFPLSNEVDTVTIEFFMKGTGLGNFFKYLALGHCALNKLSDNNAVAKPLIYCCPSAETKSHAYAQPDEDTYNAELFGNAVENLDDQWHHVALTIEPTADGRSQATYYQDYNYVSKKVLGSDKAAAVKWTGSAGEEGKDPLCLIIGSMRGLIYLDEIKITEGLLPQSRWMRQYVSPPPVDQETLLYLPFDNDVKTIVHQEDDEGAVFTANPDFADDIGRRRALSDGTKKVIREENVASLFCNKRIYYYTPSYWGFTSNQCESATIEFFYKGSTNPDDIQSNYALFRIGNDANSLRMVFYPYTNAQIGRYQCAVLGARDRTNNRTDTDHTVNYIIPRDGVMCDGKWHHVAMTTETVDGGTKGLVKFFFDYDLVKEVTFAEPWCAITPGLPGDILQIGNENSVCSIDELRITKGALPPEKFLRKFSTDGLMLIFR